MFHNQVKADNEDMPPNKPKGRELKKQVLYVSQPSETDN